jgi:hypothetical protein
VDVIKLATRIKRKWNASINISTSSRMWNAPIKDEKVGVCKGSTSSDFTKGKEKVTEPQHPKRSRDIKYLNVYGMDILLLNV